MESAYRDSAGEISAELAWHFEQGRDSARAQRYHEIAAQRAWRHAALREAVAHLRAALSIVSRLPECPARDQLELELRVGLAAALQNAQGWGSPEVQQMYAIISKLGNTRTDSRQLFRAGMALWGFAVGRGNWKEAHARAEQNTRLANLIGDPKHIAAARRAGGHGLFFLGRFDEARGHLEQALALAEAIPRGQFNNFTYARNLVSDAASVLSWTLEIAGYSDQALETIARALRAAEEGAHLADLTSVACFTGMLYWIRREWPALESWARRCVTLASENSVPYYHALGTVMAGVAAVEQGKPDYGLTLIHEGVSACRTLGTVSALSAMLLGLAQACGYAGKIPEGLEALDQSFAFAKANAEHAWEPELYRTKGELLLDPRYPIRRATRIKREREAEACFLAALELAGSQGARKWYLRAATSLCLIWQHQNARRNQARDLLAQACEAITEEGNNSDLQSAKARLSLLFSK
jgi:adenylate cyclase